MGRQRRRVPSPKLAELGKKRAGTGTAKRHEKFFAKCLVDESVSESDIDKFRQYAQRRSIQVGSFELIIHSHPGVQDLGILTGLLDADTCLLTSDRALHNATLERGHSSYFVREDLGLTAAPIPGVKPRGVLRKGVEPNPKVDQLEPPKPSRLYARLAPESERARKSLRTKRRRIRNYFGGTANMGTVAISLSTVPYSESECLIGFLIRISGNASGLKALDASARYILTPSGDPMAAYCHCLAQLILLDLALVRTNVYFDVAALEPPPQYCQSPLGELYRELAAEFPELEFTATSKGRPIERLRDKLRALRTTRTNEIVRQDLPPAESVTSEA